MADLTTLADVKEYLDIEADDNAYDSLIQRLITASSSQVETYCNRVFETQDYSESYDGNASDILFMNNTPIVSVTSLSIEGEGLDPDEFKVYDDYVRLVSGLFTPGQLNVSVQYSAGYYDPQTESPPADVEDACIQLVDFKFNLRGAEGLDERGVFCGGGHSALGCDNPRQVPAPQARRRLRMEMPQCLTFI